MMWVNRMAEKNEHNYSFYTIENDQQIDHSSALYLHS